MSREERRKANGSLFPEFENDWQREWHQMPEYVQEDLMPIKQLVINFATFEDVKAFSAFIGQKVLPTTKSIWYPRADKVRVSHLRYKTTEQKKCETNTPYTSSRKGDTMTSQD